MAKKINPETVYDTQPELMSGLLANPNVNKEEHEIYWPLFMAMLPVEANRVLDFGCGPGNFTRELANKYSDADVVGVDRVPALLPETNDRVTFRQWDGRAPLQNVERFDLIVSKMTLHYLSDDELRALAANFLRLLSPGGRIAFSVPHPFDSAKLNLDKRTEWDRRNTAGSIRREIGSTGLHATMFHRNIADWMNWIWLPMKAESLIYTPVIDDTVCNSKGEPKRLNVMFTTVQDEEGLLAYDRIEALSGPVIEDNCLVDPNSSKGREVLYGDLSHYPVRPLP